MNVIKEWVENMFIMITTISFVEIILPENTISKYIKFIFSLMIMVVIVYPVIYIVM